MIKFSYRMFGVVGVFLFCLVSANGGNFALAKDEADDIPLALKGYDPVAYFTMGKPVRGKSEFQHVFDDVRYHFVSVEHRTQFRREPDRYVPQFSGLCSMGLGAKGYKVEANPEFWAIHNDRLYLTQRDFGPPIFKKSPKRWAAAATNHIKELKDAPVGSGISWW